METGDLQNAQSIEIHDDRPLIQQGISGTKFCEGAPCGFSYVKTSSERSVSMKKLWIAIVLCIVFMSVEVVGGIKANSLAILTDAAHLLSDVAAFAISLFSLWASGWEANPRQSYGFFRIEILGALVSIQMIWLLAGILVYEAIARLIHGTGEVQGFLMFLVSAFGLVVNIIMALVLGHDHDHGHGHGHGHSYGHNHARDHGHEGHSVGTHCHREKDHGQEDDHMHTHEVSITSHQHHHEGNVIHEHHHHTLESDHCEPLLGKNCSVDEHKSRDGDKKKKQWNVNVQGAYLHVLGDSIQSIGVMIGGAIIWYKPEWTYVDLICTLVFSVIVLGTTIRMLRNILEVLMESTPREIDATRLEKGLCEMEEVVAIHELHIWAITVGKVLLACHVKITPKADPDLVLDKVVAYIKREYNISHVTIQIERDYA